ncbi:MAG: hypothetical protein H7287_09170, partial [Thermoleophilia bacterium]|nr:hypothetical protein [Thermoleophilia bacterium]
QYIEKFRSLADGVIEPEEQERFLDVAQRVGELSGDELTQLSFTVSHDKLGNEGPSSRGIFVPQGALVTA